MIKPLRNVFLCLILFKINIKSEDPVKLKYCHDIYRTEEMCDKTADDFLPASKFNPDLFATSKMIKRLLTDLYADDNILNFN